MSSRWKAPIFLCVFCLAGCADLVTTQAVVAEQKKEEAERAQQQKEEMEQKLKQLQQQVQEDANKTRAYGEDE
ncbi:MAG: hypothetical protein KDC35_05210 [Acidobacteria bacterium]|nr:hypothetical protein [Acidobacteriota bacterium]